MFKLNNNYITKKEAIEDLIANPASRLWAHHHIDITIEDYIDATATSEEVIDAMAQGASNLVYYHEAIEALKYLEWDEISDHIREGADLFSAIKYELYLITSGVLYSYEEEIEEAIAIDGLYGDIIIDEEEEPEERTSLLTHMAQDFAVGVNILSSLYDFIYEDEELTEEVKKQINANFEEIIAEAEKIEDCGGLMGFAGSLALALEDFIEGGEA